jgi:hypothetical protein
MRGLVALVVTIARKTLGKHKMQSVMLSGWDSRVEKAMRFIACSQDSEGYSFTSEQQLLEGLQRKCGWRRDLDHAGMFQAA